MTGPVVLESWQQGGRAEAEHKQKFRREAQEKNWPRSSIPLAQFYEFIGRTNEGHTRAVIVLAGEGAPIVTGGWVKVAQVPRYQRVAFTIPEGWDPITMTIPVQFEALVKVQNRKDLDADIENLEWMSGRRRPRPHEEIQGEPPKVEVFTGNGERQIPLMPAQYQSQPGQNQLWWLTNIAFDQGALRDAGGGIIRQKATITLTEIIATPSAVQRAREAREKVKNKVAKVVKAKPHQTIKAIAKEIHLTASWKTIAEFNHLSGEKHLNGGTKIKIPESAYHQVPK